MKIVLKHILKNIWEKKGRSLLIILSLIIATTVFVLNLTLPNEIILKLQETLRSIYGNSEIAIQTVEPFSIDDVKMMDEDFKYIGSSEAEISLKDKQAGILGIDIEEAKKMEMLKEDVPKLEKNEVVMGAKQAEKYSYKEGQIITAIFDEKEYELKIVKIIKGNGLTSIDAEFPMFISNLKTVNEMKGSEDEKYEQVFLNVANDANVKEFVEYLRENNENFIIENLVDVDAIKEQMSFISYIMLLIFALATIMIFLWLVH